MTVPIRPAGLKLLTSSRKRTFRRCPRRHRLLYDLGWRSTDESEALRFGTLMHEALEIWWAEHLPPAARDQHWRRVWARRGVPVEGEAIAEWAPAPLECALDVIDAAATADPFMKAKCRAALKAYHERWAPEMGHYRVLAVEIEFSIPLINPDTGAASRTWVLAGKMDVLVEDIEAAVIMPVEHKTTSKDLTEGGRYWKRLRLDGQLSTYIRGADWIVSKRIMSSEFPPASRGIDRACYDVIRRPDHRPAKATPPDEREYTKPKYKQCPACKNKHAIMPIPHEVVLGEGDAQRVVRCEINPDGRPGPRVVCTDPGGKMYANQRERDETPEEFEGRVSAAIAERCGDYLIRDIAVRTADDLRASELDDWAQAKMMHETARRPDLAIRNTDACDGEDGSCEFLDVCFAGHLGDAVLANPARFRRAVTVHEELHEFAEAPVPVPPADTDEI